VANSSAVAFEVDRVLLRQNNVNVEQCINVKLCVKIGKSAKETYNLLKKVDGDERLSHTQVFEYSKRF
jgi:hypothetical protein